MAGGYISSPCSPSIRSEPSKVRYPDNVTVANMYYFIAAPTLCYEANFPRTSRVRLGFLFRRVAEIVGLVLLIASLIQQVTPPAPPLCDNA